MSSVVESPRRPAGLLRRMTSRDPLEAHRPATPLELLYDLCFVVAIAQVAAQLHHGLSEGHVADSVVSFGVIFFAIWWAWMGFAWFASAFDTDDVAYRLKVLVQIVGVLVLAAGVPRAFAGTDFLLITLGYAIMRLGLVAQWLRAARADPGRRLTALRYAGGIAVLQIAWLGLLALPAERWIYGWMVLATLEVLLPLWAESAEGTSFHPHHIAERYGLLTIIVIGESVLATTLAIQAAVDAGELHTELLWVIASAPVILFGMWWLYFAAPAHRLLGTPRQAFVWGYGHYFVFASAAAVGAGLAVAVDSATHHSHLSARGAGLALAVPAAAYLASVWFVHFRPPERGLAHLVSFLAAIGLVLLAVVTPAPAPIIALTLAALTAYVIYRDCRRAGGDHAD